MVSSGNLVTVYKYVCFETDIMSHIKNEWKKEKEQIDILFIKFRDGSAFF